MAAGSLRRGEQLPHARLGPAESREEEEEEDEEEDLSGPPHDDGIAAQPLRAARPRIIIAALVGCLCGLAVFAWTWRFYPALYRMQPEHHPDRSIAATSMRAPSKLLHHTCIWYRVRGGLHQACQGHEEIQPAEGVISIRACRSICAEFSRCRGIEYSGVNLTCKLLEDVNGSVARFGTSCQRCKRIATHVIGADFKLVDPREDRGCSGNATTSLLTDSLEACEALCTKTSDFTCTGIEYSYIAGACKMWAQPITHTIPSSGAACLRHESRFRAVHGGVDRACRGADESDDRPSYYKVHPGVLSLGSCRMICLATPGCTGIEYGRSRGRCEVWTRPGGVRASKKEAGYSCYAFGEGTSSSLARMMSEQGDTGEKLT